MDQSDTSKIVVESTVAVQDLFASTDEWPLQPRVEEFCLDLFSADWCVRHGACMGLREIIKLQGQARRER